MNKWETMGPERCEKMNAGLTRNALFTLSQITSPQNKFWIIKRKKVTLQWRRLADNTLIKWSQWNKLTSNGINWKDVTPIMCNERVTALLLRCCSQRCVTWMWSWRTNFFLQQWEPIKGHPTNYWSKISKVSGSWRQGKPKKLFQAEGDKRHDNEMQCLILDCVFFVLNDIMGKVGKLKWGLSVRWW